MMLEVSKEFTFDAAHRLDRLPVEHKCHNLHGHTYRIIVTVRGAVDQNIGWVQDYADITAAVKPVLDRLDHKYLNDVLPCITTAENIAIWLFIELKGLLQLLDAVEVFETATSRVRYCPREL